jgi:hypothetical protein
MHVVPSLHRTVCVSFYQLRSDTSHSVCIPPARPACGRHCRVRQCASIHLSMLCPTPCRCRLPCCCSNPLLLEIDRTKNGRKLSLSVNTKIILVSYFFFSETRLKTVTPKTKTISIIRIKLETKVRYENYIGYDRNLKYDR